MGAYQCFRGTTLPQSILITEAAGCLAPIPAGPSVAISHLISAELLHGFLVTHYKCWYDLKHKTPKTSHIHPMSTQLG